MKNATYVLLFSLIFFSMACKPEKDPGPDLTTQLVGRYKAQYTIISTGTGPSEGGPSPASTVEIQRKNNNTIIVLVTINDGIVQENNRFEARVSPDDADYPTAGSRPGRKKIGSYEVKTDTSTGNLKLYDDRKILGGFIYNNAKRQQVILGIYP